MLKGIVHPKMEHKLRNVKNVIPFHAIKMTEYWRFQASKITKAPYKNAIKLVQFMTRDCQAPKVHKKKCTLKNGPYDSCAIFQIKLYEVLITDYVQQAGTLSH